ncbi:MAG: VCBS repeat-containing protein [Nitrospirae bacterium]|nr:VCBS repeat-containing protein [Nitrospirota bacterium]
MIKRIVLFVLVSVMLVSSVGAVTTYTFVTKWGGSGSQDAQFAAPTDVAFDKTSGCVYVVDKDNHRIQKFTSDGQFVSKWGSFGTGNGQFSAPFGIAVDSTGNVYVADTGNDRIQVFDSSGKFSKILGSSGTGNGQFSSPHRIAIYNNTISTTPSTIIYVTDTGNQRIQRFDSATGTWTTWSSGATFSIPKGIAVDSGGNVYVVDNGNNIVYKFNSNGQLTSGWGNGVQFSSPYGVTVNTADSSMLNNVYVADYGNNSVEQLTSTGTLVTSWGGSGLQDGQFNSAAGITVDSSNNVYVADDNNNRIQKFSASATGLAIPTGFSITPISGGFRLNWNAATGATTYLIYWGTSASINETTNSGVFITSNTSYDHTGLTSGSTYYYRIKSTAGANLSSLSGVISMTYQLYTLSVNLAGTGSGTVTASPGTLNWIGSTSTADYSQGTVVTLTATPSTGSVFAGWTGCDSASANQCTVTMSAAKDVAALFTLQQGNTLTVTMFGNGTVTASPGTLTYNGNIGTATYTPGTVVTLTATPATGSVFSTWSGCDSVSGNQCTVTMSAAKAVTASFTLQQANTLTVTMFGSGTVTASPGTLTYNGNTGIATYTPGTVVVLTATPATGFVFSAWSGCDSSSANQCTVTMNSNKAVTANFKTTRPTKMDFNGDGISDLLFYNSSTGITAIWFMSNTSISSIGSPGTMPDTNWQIKGIGDFDGDGKSDIIWQNTSNGGIYIQLMDGDTIKVAGLTAIVNSPAWQIKYIGDFNGDGKSDIMWYNTSTGMLYIWFMDGILISSGGSPATMADTTWQIKGVGDFNGDGKSDILWQNTSTGMLYIWLMNGITVTPAGSPATVADANWQIKGIGDLNGDGKSDIIWQNTSTGVFAVWFMDGAAISSAGAITQLADANWQIRTIGDFNGDGKSDICLKNTATGQFYIWLMDGSTIKGGGSPATLPDPSWNVIPLN